MLDEDASSALRDERRRQHQQYELVTAATSLINVDKERRIDYDAKCTPNKAKYEMRRYSEADMPLTDFGLI